MGKALGLIALAITLIGIGGYFGVQYTEEKQRSESIKQIEPLVKNTNIRVQTCLKVETTGQSMTWAEYFDLLKKNIDEIQENIIKAKAFETERNKSKIANTLNFMEQSQALLRLKLMEVRSRFSVSATKERISSKDMKSKDEYQKALFKHNESKTNLIAALKSAKASAKSIEYDCTETIYLINEHILEADFTELDEADLKDLRPGFDQATLKLLYPDVVPKPKKMDPSKGFIILPPEKCAEVMKTDLSTINKMGKFITVFSDETGNNKIGSLSPGVKVIVGRLVEQYYEVEAQDGTKGWVDFRWITEGK
jgi:hypothetical protein